MREIRVFEHFCNTLPSASLITGTEEGSIRITILFKNFSGGMDSNIQIHLHELKCIVLCAETILKNIGMNIE